MRRTGTCPMARRGSGGCCTCCTWRAGCSNANPVLTLTPTLSRTLSLTLTLNLTQP